MSFVYSASEPNLFKNLYEGSDEVIIGKVVSARLTEGQLNQHAIILEVDADQLILNSRCTTSQDKNRLVEVRMQGSVNLVPVGEKGIFLLEKSIISLMVFYSEVIILELILLVKLMI